MNFTKKKGDISLTTIVVAALALLVLIVLVAIFTGKIGLFSQGYGKTTDNVKDQVCGAKNGRCFERCPGTGYPFQEPGRNWIDCGAEEVCCKALLST